jgi:hypothetical protein
MAGASLANTGRVGSAGVSPTYIPTDLRQQVRVDAGRHCGYCLSPEVLLGVSLEFEHIIPEAAGGSTVRENLWLACRRCNQFKGDRIQANDPQTGESVSLFNPRTQHWADHFSWQPDGARIAGLTPCGRATVESLQLNHERIVETRRFWVEAGWWPPTL